MDGDQISSPAYAYLAQSKVPMFSNMADLPAFNTASNFFSATGTYVPGGLSPEANSKLLLQYSVKTLAIMTHPDAASQGAATAYGAAAKAAGIKIIYQNNAIPYQSFDATSVALRLKQLKPDGIEYPTSLPAAISIIRAMQQQGFTPKVNLLTTGYDPASLTSGIAGSNSVTTSSFIPYLGPVGQLTPPAQAFRNAMTKYAPQTSLNLYSAGGWATANLVLYALQLAGSCPTRDGIISKMRAVEAYNPGGIIPQNIRFSAGSTPNGDPQSCFYYIKINAASFEVPSAPLCVTQ